MRKSYRHSVQGNRRVGNETEDTINSRGDTHQRYVRIGTQRKESSITSHAACGARRSVQPLHVASSPRLYFTRRDPYWSRPTFLSRKRTMKSFKISSGKYGASLDFQPQIGVPIINIRRPFKSNASPVVEPRAKRKGHSGNLDLNGIGAPLPLLDLGDYLCWLGSSWQL